VSIPIPDRSVLSSIHKSLSQKNKKGFIFFFFFCLSTCQNKSSFKTDVLSRWVSFLLLFGKKKLCEAVKGRDWYALVAVQNWNSFVNSLYDAAGYA
jgi:hypothetical protein